MTTKTLTFTLEGQLHTLTLDRRDSYGTHIILLDGRLLEEISPQVAWNVSVSDYKVSGHTLTIVIQPNFFKFVYDLFLDGVSLVSGKRIPIKLMHPAQQAAIIIGVFLIFVGILVSWYMKADYERDQVIQEWPVASGNVIGLDTDYHHDNDNDYSDDSYYHAVLTVEYTVNDARFTIQLDDNREYDTKRETLAAHRIGEKQALYVNPSNPQEAHLFFGRLEQNGWIGGAMGVMGMMIGMALIVMVAVWLLTKGKTPPALKRFQENGGSYEHLQ